MARKRVHDRQGDYRYYYRYLSCVAIANDINRRCLDMVTFSGDHKAGKICSIRPSPESVFTRACGLGGISYSSLW